MKLFLVVLVLIWIDAGLTSSNVEWDSSGYVMFCPCMGRLGNQLEQFLGALRFTKEMNRTLVVPPWVAYDHEAGTSFTSYDTWFDIDELGKYLRVVPMETFMNELAPVHWPDDGKSRKVYCPSGAAERSPDKKSCPAKIGNPFGPFWDHSNIEFSGGSEIFDYGKLGGFNAGRWNEIYPASEHPVIAFMGAPGSFPIKEYDRGLQKYVKFSKNMLELASKFVASNLKRPYLGIHLRNGMDWVRSCDHVEGSDVYHDFMGSPQCCGYNAWKKHTLTKEMCLPSKSSIVEKVERLAKLHNTSHLFIATDHDAMINEFKETSLTLVRYPSNYPIADWAILTMADVFIGNCVSTFTSFVIRDREVNGLPNYFWAFEKEHPKVLHEEL